MGSNLSTEPWRKVKDLQWTEEYRNKLCKEVQSIKLQQDTDSNIGILVIGPSTHGKSSFINSVATVSKGRRSDIANAGHEDSHITSVYRRHTCPGDFKNFWLGDITGLTKTSVTDGMISDIKMLLSGHVKEGHKFIRDAPMDEKTKGYIKSPQPSDKIRGVVIIFSSTHACDIHSEYKMGLRLVSQLMHNKNIPRSIVLTKCDLLCSDTKLKSSNIFNSHKVSTAVDEVASGFGVPRGDVHPVVNYDCEMDEDPLLSIPLLLALRSVLYKVQDRSLQEEYDTDDTADTGKEGSNTAGTVVPNISAN